SLAAAVLGAAILGGVLAGGKAAAAPEPMQLRRTARVPAPAIKPAPEPAPQATAAPKKREPELAPAAPPQAAKKPEPKPAPQSDIVGPDTDLSKLDISELTGL
ncbi:MAG: hypothetical protein O7A03_10100, partial [Alphaproteobacteria bacterium]|nr:hypothetical protein [Alphaproteobacteria bacterium]